MKFLSRPFLLTSALILLVTGCSPQSRTPSNANTLWYCHAIDARQAHWIQYSPTRVEAATLVRDHCRAGSYRSTCVVRCIPPISRWHCVSVDKEGHTWYRNSVNKVIAIRNARQACKKYSDFGGCRVPSRNCSRT